MSQIPQLEYQSNRKRPPSALRVAAIRRVRGAGMWCLVLTMFFAVGPLFGLLGEHRFYSREGPSWLTIELVHGTMAGCFFTFGVLYLIGSIMVGQANFKWERWIGWVALVHCAAALLILAGGCGFCEWHDGIDMLSGMAAFVDLIILLAVIGGALEMRQALKDLAA